jgi:peptide/nickel transport system substrate-binding protein
MMSDDNQIASRTGWDQIRAITPGRTATGGDCPPATCFTVAFEGDYAPWKDVFSVAGGYYVLPRHVLQGKDFDTVWNTGGVVGSGPFTLESFEPGVRAVLARDPDWWGSEDTGGGPFLDRIVMNFLDSPAATLTALRQGEAQMASFLPDPELIGRAGDIEGMTVQQVPSLFFEHVILNTEAAPLDDPAVRQALAHAIDREQVVEVLQEGTVPVLQSLLRPSQLGYSPTYERYGYDPQRAIDILEQAGWERGDDGIFAKNGQALEIPMATFSDDELRQAEVRLMADQAAEAGIRIDLRSRTGDQLFEDLGQGTFTSALIAFGGGVDPSPTALLASDQIPSEENGFTGQNVYRWSNAEVDRLLRSSDREIDEAARVDQLGRIQEILADEVPLIPLYAQANTVAHVEALQGVKENPTQAEVFWNSGEWSLAGGG